MAAAATALAIVATTRVESWGRRPWQTPWLALPVPPFGLQPDSLVLMVGQPSGFAVPSFREDARFVNLTAVDRFRAPAAWDPLVAQAVATHRGPILLLSNFEFSRADCDRRAARLGLQPTPRCEPIRNGSLRFRLCELERTSSTAPALSHTSLPAGSTRQTQELEANYRPMGQRARKVVVVVPFLNEEENLPALYERLVRALEGEPESFELLFVDDGSSDGSRPLGRRAARRATRGSSCCGCRATSATSSRSPPAWTTPTATRS